MITLAKKTYMFGESRQSLEFFKSETRFREHLERHFLSEKEPWERLFGKKKMDRIRGKVGRGEVIDIQNVYDEAVAILDDGIMYSVQRPVYVEFLQQIEEQRSTWHERGKALLAEKGFIVVAVHGRIVTAFFVENRPDDSYYTLYKEAWDKLNTKFRKRKYIDDNREPRRTVENLDVRFVEDAEWRQCMNPHGKRRLRPFIPEGEHWTDRFVAHARKVRN